MSSAGQHKWKVVFDFDGKEKECPSRSLRIVPGDAGIPLDELSNGANREANKANGEASGRANRGANRANRAGRANRANRANRGGRANTANGANGANGATEDPSANDAFNEEEDGGGGNSDDDSHNETNDDALMPNNSFCFTEEDFVEHRSLMNNVTRHGRVYCIT